MKKQKPIKRYFANKYESPYGVVDTQTSPRSTIIPIIEFLKTKQDGSFLEIGVLGGSTLLGIYNTCKKQNIKVYGVDPWENVPNLNGFSKDQVGEAWWDESNQRRKKLREHLQNIISTHSLDIKLFHNVSEAIVNNFNNESIDCIHVDGSHSYEGVSNDMKLFWPKLKPSGLMLMDDYQHDWPEVVQAVDEFIEGNNNEISSHERHLNKMKIYKR